MSVLTSRFLSYSEGSNLTPAHHHGDFRFKTYAPIAFRYFRELFGIRPDDYLVRWNTHRYAHEIFLKLVYKWWLVSKWSKKLALTYPLKVRIHIINIINILFMNVITLILHSYMIILIFICIYRFEIFCITYYIIRCYTFFTFFFFMPYFNSNMF